MIPLYDLNRSDTRPIVTAFIITVNILAFLYEVSLDPYSRHHFISEFGLIPARLQLFDFVTSMFLHGGWMHIIGNMWFLWIFGDNVEDVLGRGRFLIFYLACGLFAALAQILVSPDSRVPMIGASGAIAGVMGAYVVKFPRARVVTLIPIIIFFTTIEVPAVLMLVYWFLLQLFSGLGSVGDMHLSQGGVAFFAHVGGFVAGMVLIKIFPTKRPQWRREDLNW